MTLPKWQYITQGETAKEHLDNAYAALDAGCQWIQLRMKRIPSEIILQTALELSNTCRAYDALFIMNDKVDIAIESKADGVHLGKKDLAPNAARTLMDDKTIIGGTANTFKDIQFLKMQGVDYIGLGPYKFTSTKKELSPILGINGYKEIISQMEKNAINIPVFAIGGIVIEDIGKLKETGIHGIAISGLLTKSDNKVKLVDNINQLLAT